jgi:hypothetical protein
MSRHRVNLNERPAPLDHFRDMISDVESGELEEYYPATAAGEMEEDRRDAYRGRKVVWLGEAGRMVKAPADRVQPLDQNIFSARKLRTVANAVRFAQEPLVFEATYAQAMLVDPSDVAESIQSAPRAELDNDIRKPLTTGSPELDEYLAFPEEVLAEAGKPRSRARAAEEKRLKAELAQAVRDRDGDLGKLLYSVRDGNHRVFGALLGGEPYVWLMLDQNTLQDLRRPSEGSEAWAEELRKAVV